MGDGGVGRCNLRVMKVSCPLFSCLVLTRLRACYCFSVTWNQQGSEPLHSSFPPPIFSHPTELYPFALFTHIPLNNVKKKAYERGPLPLTPILFLQGEMNGVIGEVEQVICQ